MISKEQKETLSESNILVSISCITYNHAAYIRKCLEGFIMQKTDFEYEILIHDDASTDGTADIIYEYEKKYPNIIKPIYQKENKYSQGIKVNRTYNYPRAKGKYIAICEGDDYWTDPLKLQKQVDIFKKDVTCSLIVTNGYIQDIKSGKKRMINPFGNRNSGEVSLREVFVEKGHMIPTASMCFKREFITMPKEFGTPPVGDRPLRMWCAINGTVYYLAEPMLIYRINCKGSFGDRISRNEPYARQIYEGMNVFYDKFNEYTSFRYSDIIELLKEREYYDFCIRIGDRLSVIKCPYFKRLAFLRKIKFWAKTRLLQILKRNK